MILVTVLAISIVSTGNNLIIMLVVIFVTVSAVSIEAILYHLRRDLRKVSRFSGRLCSLARPSGVARPRYANEITIYRKRFIRWMWLHGGEHDSPLAAGAADAELVAMGSAERK